MPVTRWPRQSTDDCLAGLSTRSTSFSLRTRTTIPRNWQKSASWIFLGSSTLRRTASSRRASTWPTNSFSFSST
ncbi:hypothetical protein BaRGS_00005054, partial [Batillaria attramentaria]